MSKFIVIEGTDGSGKGTQAGILVAKLEAAGKKVAYFDFPQYGQESAVKVEQYLRGEMGELKDIGPKQASAYYAEDRLAASPKIKAALESGNWVVCNRYVSANKGHQMGKIEGDEARNEFLKWLNKLEYEDNQIPKPDVTLLLYVSPEVGQKLVDKKAARDYLGGEVKRDIHEADINHLEKAAEAFRYCVENDKSENWVRIDCQEGGDDILSVEVIADKIWALLTKKEA